MKAKINNIGELKLEIARLNRLKLEQESYLIEQYNLLKRKVEAPARFVGAITSSIPGVDFITGLLSSLGDSTKKGPSGKKDWLTRTLQLGLPLVLNKTFLKNSGWFKKAIVLLASETAAGQVTQDKVGSLISKITDFVRPKGAKKKRPKGSSLPEREEQDTVNFGIPPDSETY